MERIFWYFDLYSQHRDNNAKAQNSSGDNVGIGTQLLIYLGCLVGIVTGPFIIPAASGVYPTLQQVFGGWPHLLWSALIALVLTAGLFKIWLTPKTPILGQIGSAIIVGIGSVKLLPIVLAAFDK